MGSDNSKVEAKEVAEVNKSSGIHVFEMHAPLVGTSIVTVLMMIGFAALVFFLYRKFCKNRASNRSSRPRRRSPSSDRTLSRSPTRRSCRHHRPTELQQVVSTVPMMQPVAQPIAPAVPQPAPPQIVQPMVHLPLTAMSQTVPSAPPPAPLTLPKLLPAITYDGDKARIN